MTTTADVIAYLCICCAAAAAAAAIDLRRWCTVGLVILWPWQYF